MSINGRQAIRGSCVDRMSGAWLTLGSESCVTTQITAAEETRERERPAVDLKMSKCHVPGRLALLAERRPRVGPVICAALLDNWRLLIDI